jgi:hypothetical protein
VVKTNLALRSLNQVLLLGSTSTLVEGQTPAPQCSEASHNVKVIGITKSGHPGGLCSTSIGSAGIHLMNYHMQNVEGYQSQSFMRMKVSALRCLLHNTLAFLHLPTRTISLDILPTGK